MPVNWLFAREMHVSKLKTGLTRGWLSHTLQAFLVLTRFSNPSLTLANASAIQNSILDSREADSAIRYERFSCWRGFQTRQQCKLMPANAVQKRFMTLYQLPWRWAVQDYQGLSNAIDKFWIVRVQLDRPSRAELYELPAKPMKLSV